MEQTEQSAEFRAENLPLEQGLQDVTFGNELYNPGVQEEQTLAVSFVEFKSRNIPFPHDAQEEEETFALK
jgi:hypothetical protein